MRYELTSVLGNIAVQTAEDDVDLVLELFRAAVLEHKIAQLLAHGHALLPLHGIAVLLAGIPGAGSNCGKSEVRVQSEKEDEALAYTASSAEHAYKIMWSAIGLIARASAWHRTVACHAVPRIGSGLTNRTASWESSGPER